MSVNVIASTLVLVSASYIQPVVDVSWVEATAEASYIQPQFQASWVDIQVTAEVSMPDVLAVDIVTPTDLVSLTTTKNTTDSVTSVDVSTRSLAKVLSETLTTADVITIVKTVTPVFGDSVTMSDVFSSLFDKGALDAVALNDTTAFDYSKPLGDSYATVDAFGVSFITSRSETLTTADDSVLAVDKQVADTVAPADANSFDITKVLEDFITLADSANITTGIPDQFEFDSFGFIDVQVIDFGLNKDDNVTTASLGYLLSQDYCDITYFAEDYVGTSRTFT